MLLLVSTPDLCGMEDAMYPPQIVQQKHVNIHLSHRVSLQLL